MAACSTCHRRFAQTAASVWSFPTSKLVNRNMQNVVNVVGVRAIKATPLSSVSILRVPTKIGIGRNAIIKFDGPEHRLSGFRPSFESSLDFFQVDEHRRILSEVDASAFGLEAEF